MIFHGLLRRLCEKWCASPEGALANELIRDQGGIISAEPARRLKELAAQAISANEMPALVKMLGEGSVLEICRAVTHAPAFKTKLDEYLAKFGDRCLDELKLESATLHDDPLPLFRSIGALASRTVAQASNLSHEPIANSATSDHVASGGGQNAAPTDTTAEMVRRAFDGHGIRSLVFNWVLHHARARVRDRENLRFERTRLFGRVRRIFVEIGKRLHADGCLAAPRDIFFLELNEAVGFLDGTAATTDLKPLVALRRTEFDRFRNMTAPADRFETRGGVNHAHDYQPRHTAGPDVATGGETRQGLGCCPGIVRGSVRVITEPRGALIKPNEILVAERTDPGWVMLFPAAAGLLVERGSLLSHSAIVSRELGLPGIVSIAGLTAWLRTGDVVEMDGSTGVVRRIVAAD
jgi:pyruvate,water dikinase